MKKKKLWQRLGALLLVTAVLAGSIPADSYAAEVEPVVAAEMEADTATEETESVQEDEILPEIPVNEELEEEKTGGEVLPEIPVKNESETDPEVTENGETEGQIEDEEQEDEQQQEPNEENQEEENDQHYQQANNSHNSEPFRSLLRMVSVSSRLRRAFKSSPIAEALSATSMETKRAMFRF